MKNIFFKNKKNASAGRPGFSLVEMIVAIFIFSLVMTTVTAVFVQVFHSRKKAKEIQTNIEDARYAMELMAKTLRMSSVKSSEGTVDNIVIFDYSQNKCIKYYKDVQNKLSSMSSPDDVDSCSDGMSGTAQVMTGGNLNDLSFEVIKTDKDKVPKTIGRVTVAMTICADDVSVCRTKETIQTTVSLRDYGNVD